MSTNKSQTNGAYQDLDVIWHQHSNKLLIAIMEFFKPDVPVVDLGCGHNWYMNTLKFLGYDAIGVDSVPLVGVTIIGDVTNPQLQKNFGPSKRNVLSLEVGEHIPDEIADGYLDNVCMFGGDVILSWAVVGQAGIGHINCKSNEWVIEQMKERSYILDSDKTFNLRHAVYGCHCSWFKNSIMYFKHKYNG